MKHSSLRTLGSMTRWFGAITLTLVLAACGGGSDVTLQSISITPTNPSAAKGTTKQFTATGNYSDGTTQDVTDQSTWTSSDISKATVNSAGLATAVAVGSPTISAAVQGVIGTTTLTVTAATLSSIAVTPPNPSIALGTTRQFTATGTFTDATTQDLTNQVTWASADEAKATINGTGLATSAAVGSTNISATLGSIAGSTTLTITAATLQSIAVTPANAKLPVDFKRQYIATGTYSDNSTQPLTLQVTWSSSNTNEVTVGASGIATGVAPGTPTITATLGDKSGSTPVTVTNATLSSIAVTPATPTIALGNDQHFVATGTFSDASTLDLTGQVTWTSGDTGVAEISNASGSRGLATSVAAGTSLISATVASTTGSTTLTVSPAQLLSIDVAPATSKLAVGFTRQYTATGTYTNGTSDITSSVTWSVSDPSKLSVSNAGGSEGLATALAAAANPVTISATLTGVVGTASVNVTDATLSSIAVTPADATIALSSTEQYTATGTFSDSSTQDLTTQVTWSSSDPSTATISNASGSEGLATSVAAGTTTITATSGAKSGNTTLTVSAATLTDITVTPAATSLPTGFTRKYTATGTYSDASTQDVTAQVTWASNDTSVATVSNAIGSRGVVTGVAVGTASISATLGAVTGQTTTPVTDASLTSIAVTPIGATLPVDYHRRFTAIGTFSDASTLDITTQVVWSSTHPENATVSNTAGYQGVATGIAAGVSAIAATAPANGDQGGANVSGAVNMTVTDATLSSIAVTPSNPTVHGKSQTQQFTATGTFSDASTLDLTQQVAWSSSDTTIATISNALFSPGLATTTGTTATGTTTITATGQVDNTKTGTTVLTKALP